MSRYAPTPCLECTEYATHRGRCAKHQREPWLGSTRRERLPSDWNTRRLIVLKRDKGICYLCGVEGADAVDHIQPGDDHSLHNLGSVHDRTPPHCHRAKTAQEGAAAANGNKIKRRL
jgi:5-methylcytosine-specific restriction endonuclease McrA